MMPVVQRKGGGWMCLWEDKSVLKCWVVAAVGHHAPFALQKEH